MHTYVRNRTHQRWRGGRIQEKKIDKNKIFFYKKKIGHTNGAGEDEHKKEGSLRDLKEGSSFRDLHAADDEDACDEPEDGELNEVCVMCGVWCVVCGV